MRRFSHTFLVRRALLYDLRTDADELHNLAKQPAQAKRVKLPPGTPRLAVEVAADSGRAWEFSLCVNNREIEKRAIIGGAQLEWQMIETGLNEFAGQTVTLRLYQNLLTGIQTRPPSAAHWKTITLK